MKSSILSRIATLAVLCLPFVCFADEIHTNIAGVEIFVDSLRSSYPTGTPVIIRAIVINGTGKDVFWTKKSLLTNDCGDTFSRIQVKALPQATIMPCKLEPTTAGSKRSDMVPPLRGYEWSDNLAFEYGLAEPGVYEVTLMLEKPSFEDSGWAAEMVPTPSFVIVISDHPPTDAWVPEQMIASSGPAVEGLRAEVKLPKREFSVGEAIRAVVLLHNGTETNREFGEPLSTSLANISLASENGSTVAPAGAEKARLQHRQEPEAESRGWFQANIPAHGQRWYDYRLDQSFDLTMPGTYTLTVRLPRPRRPGEPDEHESNLPQIMCGPITFRVEDPPTEKPLIRGSR